MSYRGSQSVDASRPYLKRITRPLLRILVTILAVTPFAYSLFKEWPSFQNALQTAEWGAYFGAQLLLIPIMFLMGVLPWISLRYLEESFSLWKATGIYFFTQLFKYLPGGFWALPGRMAVYRIQGVGQAQSVVSVLREIIALFLGAGVIGLIGLLQGLSITGTLQLALGIGILVSIAALILTQLPGFWKLLSSIRWFRTSSISDYASLDRKFINFRWLPRALLASVLFWLLFGLSFRQLAVAIHPEAQTLSWIEASSIFALAWCAGFVVVFVPAGIGVREGVLTLLLTGLMPAGAALSLALLARLAWLVAEGFWILVTLVWINRSTDISWEALRRYKDSTNSG